MDFSLISYAAFLACTNIWAASTVVSKELKYETGNINRAPNQDYQRELLNTYAIETNNIGISSEPAWPDKNIKFGQVSGVSLDNEGYVYVFHRGSRIWEANTFQPNNVFTDINQGPLKEHTVAVIHPKTGALLYEWGSQLFYLPHSITVDNHGNVWITDVAMHQVFKFPPIFRSKNNNTVPLLTLGTRFRPGNSLSMFCKPTAVAVMSTGEFFVSDGYCNSRIIKYAPDGTVVLHWGRSSLTTGPTVPVYHFFVPHDLTLAEDKNLLCVSDRENGRIECFQTSNGSYVYQIMSPELGTRLFSASYTPANDGVLFIVNGPALYGTDTAHGSIVSMNTDSFRMLKVFQPDTREEPTFQNPHDLIVSPNGTELYVVELSPFRAWKFNIVGLHPSPPVAMGRNTEPGLTSQYTDGKTSGSMLMAIFITAIVLCFGAVLLTAALVYSRARMRGCSGHCKNAKWLVGRSSVEGFKLGNFLGQQNQGFVKLNNLEESDEDDVNVSPSFA